MRTAPNVIVALVGLPTPLEVAEVHLVARIVTEESQRLIDPRFFTLEHGVRFPSDEPRTVLCEWTSDGTHRNYGDGPDVIDHAFVDAAMVRYMEAPIPGQRD